MWKLAVSLFAALALLSYIEVEARLQLGKCSGLLNLELARLPIRQMAKHGHKWSVAYVTENLTEGTNWTNSANNSNVTQNINACKELEMKKKRVVGARYEYGFFTYEVLSDSGNIRKIYLYPLGVTRSLASLMYICSDDGNPNYKQRVITFLRDVVPSEAEYKELLALDKARFPNTPGRMIELPEQLKDKLKSYFACFD